MTGGDMPYRGDNARLPDGAANRLPAAQVFRRTTPPRQAPWERDANGRPREVSGREMPGREMRSYPAPPSPDGGPAPDNSVTQLIPRFRDEDFPPVETQPTPGPEAPAPKSQQKSLLAATGSIAIATLVSRITGFFKQIVMLAILGSAIASSFTSATILPNMISELVLGAVLTAIVVPVLVRAEIEDPDRGASFIRRLFTLAFTMLAIVALIATIGAPVLSNMLIDDTAKVSSDLTTALSYLLLPAILFYGLSGLLTAILNTRQNFRPGAWAPVWNNLVVLGIFSLYFLVPGEISLDPVQISDPHVLILGLGVTAGVITQVAALIPALKREKVDLRPLWGFDARLKTFGGMAAAIVLYVVISQAGLVFATNISAHADEAGPVIYSQAWILLQLPYGILGVTVLTAIMPRLSRSAANGDTPAVVDDLSVATRMTLVALVPIVVFLTFAGPWVGEALFGHGNFKSDAPRLGEAVSWSAFTLIPYALVLIHLRVFYAREQAWTPTWIILGITGVKIALSALAPVLAQNDQQVVLWLGVANGLGFVVGACIGGFLLNRSLGNLRMINIGKTIWMVLIASAAGGTAMLAIDRIADLSELTENLGFIGAMLRVGIGAILMLGITFAILWFGRIPEVLAVTVAIRRLVLRVRGKSVPAPQPVEISTDVPGNVTTDPAVGAGADKTLVVPVVASPTAWDTARDRLPYPGPRRAGTPSVSRGPQLSGRDRQPGAYTREGVRVTDDDVAGGPAEAVVNGTDRATGGVEVDERAKNASSQAESTLRLPSSAKLSVEKNQQPEAGSPETDEPETAPEAHVEEAEVASNGPDDDAVTDVSASDDAESAAAATPAGTSTPAAPPTEAVSAASGAAARTPRGPQLMPGASVAGGRYRLLAPHGGARGLKFWQAHDVKLDREVALTFVDADQRASANSADGPEGPQAILSRTLRLGRINSPGLARVLDVVRGSSGGIVVAEWTPGRSLREMADTVPSPTGAARAIKALAGAAEAAHRSGGALSIDHPDRVRISTSGNAVLAFPATLADADPGSDVRGLGAMLYALITARWPLVDPAAGGGPPRSVGGMKPADRDGSGNAVEPRRIRSDVPFEISAVAVRALEQNSGIRTAATVQHVLDQAAVVNDKTDLMPALRLGQRAPGANGHSLADPEEIAAEQQHSRRTNIALVVLGVLTVVVLGFAGYWLFTFIAGGSTDEPLTEQKELGLTTSQTAPAVPGAGPAAVPAAAPVAIDSVEVFSPEGSADNVGTADNAVDGDPSTLWGTDSYFQPFPSLKNGVGLLVSLPSSQVLTNATVNSPSPGTVVEIRSAPSDSPSLSDTTVIGQATLGSGVTEIPLQATEPTSHVLLWITGLSSDTGRNQSSIADIVFTAQP
ncbi:murein biosynthesis integral membrane protein MurJ [Rhodococcus sp. G-MC3]|uniref:murein biosynthesis integral membrane protein MurJ n=1 Tax=Rhodococcus sp. G-MC3 TaxID=3046209 RepID=UPI0024B9D6CF|nr:murein biosynthesis integral membrane protein MurJ [Rhodococcus sp. G-MC3]MDJ0393574.1 murein biosynthesis integral membrane protein MurJ [Rhodococcus sp. G-MC3]